MNRSGYIVDTLREAGIDAYLPGQHDGICLSPYVVVRQMSGVLTGGGGMASYRVMVLVPEAMPELLDLAAQSAADALVSLEKHGIRLTRPRGPVLTDDTFRAVTTYLEYTSYFS